MMIRRSRPNGRRITPLSLPGLAEAVNGTSGRRHFPEVGLFNDRIDCACGWYANPATPDDWWDHVDDDDDQK